MKLKLSCAFRASLACASLLLGNQSAQAAEATGTASATILQPVTVTKVADLDFGKVVAGPNASTVVLGANGVFTCGSGLTCLDDHAAARFSISGVPGMTVNIQADSQITLSSPTGAQMPVTLVTSAKTLKLGNGAGNLLGVGGTLSVSAYQPEGLYTGLFTVTVNYN